MAPTIASGLMGFVEGRFGSAGFAENALDEEVDDGDRDIGQQQARDRLVDAAGVPHPTDQADPAGADDDGGQPHRQRNEHRWRPIDREGWQSHAAEKPAMTSAPSPPMTIRPMRAGMATQSAVRISGAARTSVFCHENSVPNPPRAMRKKNSPATCRGRAGRSRTTRPRRRSAPTGMMKVSRTIMQPRADTHGSNCRVWTALPPSRSARTKPAVAATRRCRSRATVECAQQPSDGPARMQARSGDRSDDALDQIVHAPEDSAHRARASCR